MIISSASARGTRVSGQCESCASFAALREEIPTLFKKVGRWYLGKKDEEVKSELDWKESTPEERDETYKREYEYQEEVAAQFGLLKWLFGLGRSCFPSEERFKLSA